MTADLADQIDALLPQTQCTRCGFTGCRPYAQAIAEGIATTDRCPPGGAPVAEALAALIRGPVLPLNPEVGVEKPPQVVVIDETICIGCAKCLPACPVDAIVGARKYLHTVIAQECSGCELCLPPCPVDCITIVPVGEAPLDWPSLQTRATRYRQRYHTHTERETRREEERRARLSARSLRSDTP